jgi:Phage T4 tail fibre
MQGLKGSRLISLNLNPFAMKIQFYFTTVFAVLVGAAIQAQNTFPATGNVGVGTTTPRGKFDVDGPGDIFLSDDTNVGTSQSLYLPGHIYMAPYNGSNVIYLQARRANNSGTTIMRLRTYDNGTLTDAMNIEGNGNVGIGNNSPSEKLSVQGNIQIPLTSSIGFAQSDRFTHSGNQIGNYSLGWSNDSWNSGAPSAYFSGFGGMKFFTQAQPRMAINPAGNVGIGTLNPDFKLTVNGKIKAEEVQVVVDVPADYVFEKDYNLMPLSEVDKFVKENKHLPNIPNAEAIKANGWPVGEMNNKLLEKIEELTLYMIELKKENEELKKRVGKLEKE